MSESSLAASILLQQAKSGDPKSLGRLLSNYFSYLNRLSKSHLDDRIGARVSASDIVQETLLEAHRDFGAFSGKSIGEFTAWLRRILFSNLATAIEKHILAEKRDVRKQRSINQSLREGDQSRARLANLLKKDITSPSTPIQREESLGQLLKAIDQLPDDYQQVIRWRHFEDLSFKEIAKRLDRNSGAVRMIWVRAITKLRSLMADQENRDG